MQRRIGCVIGCVYVCVRVWMCVCVYVICIGLARTIYIRCVYGMFGRENTQYMVIYGVYIRSWPTLNMHVIRGLVDTGIDKRQAVLGMQ
jgi:hypothetical protein